MSKRVQVILPDDEREVFARQAAREGLSLSAWLRRSGRERLAIARREARLSTVAKLRAFFRECDGRERGREPDWDDHRAVIARSAGSGTSGT